MPTMINDNRQFIAMSEADADALLQEIAQAEIRCARHKAETESRIADLKAAYQEEKALCDAIVNRNAARIERYVAAHPERFQKPRARKTDWGRYGLRTVSGPEIDDDDAVIDYARAHGIERLLEVKYKLRKEEVKQMLQENTKLPGCRLLSGERSFYAVAKALLDQAKQLPGMEG